jgi:anti-sigma-K factor RskA
MNDETLHDDIRNDLAAYALGALDAETCERLEQHLAECAACRAALFDYQEVAGLLPFALPIQAPPPGARSLLLERARAAGAERPAGRLARLAPARLRSRMATLAASLVLLVVAAGVGGYFLGERSVEPSGPGIGWEGEQIDGFLVPMTGSDAAPAAVGQLIVYRDEDRAILLVSDLPTLAPDQEYQFWFVEPDRTHVKCALFEVDQHGQAVVRLTIPGPTDEFAGIGVTLEPAGGSTEPTGQVMMTGQLPE